jgi:hypothetical protein
MWEQAIRDRADWVQIVTWNDYSEATEIAPSTGIQHAFYDLAAYYIARFKTGKAPPVVRDVLYYFHRIAPVAARPDLARQAQPMQLRPGSEPASDEVELLAFLKAPGVLEVEINNKRYRKVVGQAGMTSFRVPLQPGAPSFRLYRQSRKLIEVKSAFTIRDRITYQDLLYRAGGSSRPAVAMAANPPLLAP